MTSSLFENVANSIFPKFNEKQGIMLCGYEWGFSKEDERQSITHPEKYERRGALHTFSNKAAEYGDVALAWRYDSRIINWFNLFGHPLDRQGLGGDFDKCILQTNWCDSLNNKVEGDYYAKLLSPDQINNFISYIDHFQPKVIFFFGTKIIEILQSEKVLPQFINVMGSEKSKLQFVQKDPLGGRAFRVGFQSFDKCEIVCFPHPSGTHGLRDDYIKQYSTEISKILEDFKKFKQIN